MQLAIRHETVYRYTEPLAYTIQQLRLTPRADPHQHVLRWDIAASGQCNAFNDAYGNAGHMLTITKRHQQIRILASGVIDIAPLYRGRLQGEDKLSPLVYTVPTRLTCASDPIRQFATRHIAAGAQSADLLGLAQAICNAVAYQSGATLVTTTADNALALGYGVCQDHAHLFLACCHAAGIPARYVSGYIDPETTEHAASHAWVDAWVDEADFSGWVSIDVTHARLVGEAHCRLAIGRDYESAAPVRGVRNGGGDEALDVSVHVTPANPQFQQQGQQ